MVWKISLRELQHCNAATTLKKIKKKLVIYSRTAMKVSYLCTVPSEEGKMPMASAKYFVGLPKFFLLPASKKNGLNPTVSFREGERER